MPGKFACFKVKAKAKAGRGATEAAQNVLDGLEEMWDDLQEKLEGDSDMKD